MDEENKDGVDRVEVSMNINGEYNDVLSKLQPETSGKGEIAPIFDDTEILLETIVQMGGGTRSAIAQQLPAEMNVTFDAEAVVDTLRVLERYGLVTLEGNTWKSGPKLQE